ncbi:MAG: HEPN domain-containing protein [Acetobacteraceae bacterium]|nr:HEPN domain-containing protein [Acetobacteraceae bacterium]
MSAPDPAELWEQVLSWIRVAMNDQRIAELCLNADPPALAGAAYHCQQAAAKLLKGFLVRACADFGKTHDLHYLGTGVARLFPQVRSLVEPMAAWTHWAVCVPLSRRPRPRARTVDRGTTKGAGLDRRAGSRAEGARPRRSGLGKPL